MTRPTFDTNPLGRAALAVAAITLVVGCTGAARALPADPHDALTVDGSVTMTVVLAMADPGEMERRSTVRQHPAPMPGEVTRGRIATWIERLESDPGDIEALLGLGFAAYQLARETADPSELARAQEAFDTVLVAQPDNVEALIGLGTVALSRHEFSVALELAERARSLAPQSARVYGVMGDALVELGRYDEATDAIQTMVDTRPDLASYARVSYIRELRGHLDGAIAAMEDAVRAGGPDPENTEYVRTALGDLWFLAGDLDQAETTYLISDAEMHGYVGALVGLGRVAAARGDLVGAISRFEQAAAQVPLPGVLILLGEAQEAAGMVDESAATYQLVRDVQSLFAANGVRTDLELALFEADHGDPGVAVELARAAYAQTPNVKAADALAWALYGAGALDEARGHAEEAIRLGSLEPAYYFHAGMIAKAQGDDPMARAWLRQSLRRNPAWSPLWAPIAAAALAELGGEADA